MAKATSYRIQWARVVNKGNYETERIELGYEYELEPEDKILHEIRASKMILKKQLDQWEKEIPKNGGPKLDSPKSEPVQNLKSSKRICVGCQNSLPDDFPDWKTYHPQCYSSKT